MRIEAVISLSPLIVRQARFWITGMQTESNVGSCVCILRIAQHKYNYLYLDALLQTPIFFFVIS